MRSWRARAQPDDGGYVAVMPATDVPAAGPIAARAGDVRLVLIRLGAEILAFGRYCPHAAGDFAQGRQAGARLTCPEHDYTFDLRTDRVLWPPDEVYRLRRYPVRVVDGMVRVRPG